MLHYVHQIVPNFVYLPFGAGQVAYSQFSELFFFLNTDESGETEPKQKSWGV